MFKLGLGAEFLGNGRTQFRVWAPKRAHVEVVLEGEQRTLPLSPEEGGYFVGTHAVDAGSLYRFRLDRGDSFPDPCSRFQPQGPHGPSQVVDPSTFRWSDSAWKGLQLQGQVFYELHIGTFTPEGTYAAILPRLADLVKLGITAIELMPLATFPGRFNWGYDGVGMFAPSHLYGSPDELRRLVDEAHRLGLGVILDVVYNHFGPDGNYLNQYSPSYFSKSNTEWGEAINFDGTDAHQVRHFFIQNACYWISEFHFDGLRLDATHAIVDRSERHVLAEVSERARKEAGSRNILLVAETETQDARLVAPVESGGCGLDAIWVDDFHHAAIVAAAGRKEAYLQDYQGTAQELLACARHNALYQGQWYSWQKHGRGSPLFEIPAERVVFFLQNHDQVSNHLKGWRLDRRAGDAKARALTTYFLLLPQTPLLFMGEEYFAQEPFLYFTDHNPDLQAAVNRGRDGFLCQFPSASHAIQKEGYRAVQGEQAFERSRLRPTASEEHQGAFALHRELLHLRKRDPVFAAQNRARLEGEILSSHALLLRFFGTKEQGDRLILLNLGADLTLTPSPQPLLAPISGRPWRPLLSSEETRFGGLGAVLPEQEGSWKIAGSSALVMTSTET